MIPVGTLCYIVRASNDRKELIGHVGTVQPHTLPCFCTTVGMNGVCDLVLPNGLGLCIREWSCLRPIGGPPSGVTVPMHEGHTA